MYPDNHDSCLYSIFAENWLLTCQTVLKWSKNGKIVVSDIERLVFITIIVSGRYRLLSK